MPNWNAYSKDRLIREVKKAWATVFKLKRQLELDDESWNHLLELPGIKDLMKGLSFEDILRIRNGAPIIMASEVVVANEV